MININLSSFFKIQIVLIPEFIFRFENV